MQRSTPTPHLLNALSNSALSDNKDVFEKNLLCTLEILKVIPAEILTRCVASICRNITYTENPEQCYKHIKWLLELGADLKTHEQYVHCPGTKSNLFHDLCKIRKNTPFRSAFKLVLQHMSLHLMQQEDIGGQTPITLLIKSRHPEAFFLLHDYFSLLGKKEIKQLQRNESIEKWLQLFQEINDFRLSTTFQWHLAEEQSESSFSTLPFFQDLMDGHFDAVTSIINIQPNTSLLKTKLISDLIQFCFLNRHFDAAFFLMNQHVYPYRFENDDDQMHISDLLFFVAHYYGYLSGHEKFNAFLTLCFECRPNIAVKKNGDTLLHTFLNHYFPADQLAHPNDVPHFLTLLFQYPAGLALLNELDAHNKLPIHNLCLLHEPFAPWFDVIVSKTTLKQLDQKSSKDRVPITYAINKTNLLEALTKQKNELTSTFTHELSATSAHDQALSSAMMSHIAGSPKKNKNNLFKQDLRLQFIYSNIQAIFYMHRFAPNAYDSPQLSSPLLSAFENFQLDFIEFFLFDVIMPNLSNIKNRPDGKSMFSFCLYHLIDQFSRDENHSELPRCIQILKIMLGNDLCELTMLGNLLSQEGKSNNIFHIIASINHPPCSSMLNLLLFRPTEFLLNQENARGQLPLHAFLLLDEQCAEMIERVLLHTTQKQLDATWDGKTAKEIARAQNKLHFLKLIEHHESYLRSLQTNEFEMVMTWSRWNPTDICYLPKEIWNTIFYFATFHDARFGILKRDEWGLSVELDRAFSEKLRLIPKVKAAYAEAEELGLTNTVLFSKFKMYFATISDQYALADQLTTVVDDFLKHRQYHQQFVTLNLLYQYGVIEKRRAPLSVKHGLEQHGVFKKPEGNDTEIDAQFENSNFQFFKVSQ